MIDAGAKINPPLRVSPNESVLYLVVERGNVDLVRYFLSCGASTWLLDRAGRTILEAARIRQAPKLIIRLLKMEKKLPVARECLAKLMGRHAMACLEFYLDSTSTRWLELLPS
jgi:hypothetical protein